jgi:hypothetical protein
LIETSGQLFSAADVRGVVAGCGDLSRFLSAHKMVPKDGK